MGRSANVLSMFRHKFETPNYARLFSRHHLFLKCIRRSQPCRQNHLCCDSKSVMLIYLFYIRLLRCCSYHWRSWYSSISISAEPPSVKHHSSFHNSHIHLFYQLNRFLAITHVCKKQSPERVGDLNRFWKECDFRNILILSASHFFPAR